MSDKGLFEKKMRCIDTQRSCTADTLGTEIWEGRKSTCTGRCSSWSDGQSWSGFWGNRFAYFKADLISSVGWLSRAEVANRLNDRRSAGRHAPPSIDFPSEPRKRRGLKGQRRKFRQRLKQRKQLRVKKKKDREGGRDVVNTFVRYVARERVEELDWNHLNILRSDIVEDSRQLFVGSVNVPEATAVSSQRHRALKKGQSHWQEERVTPGFRLHFCCCFFFFSSSHGANLLLVRWVGFNLC